MFYHNIVLVFSNSIIPTVYQCICIIIQYILLTPNTLKMSMPSDDRQKNRKFPAPGANFNLRISKRLMCCFCLST